jgi:solute:Na+ symporter, SSS family
MVTAVVALTAVISGLRVHSTREFTVAGRRAGWPIVSGIMVGALVGGSSTVGTAQAAFVYGLAAWWFTLGAGIGCLILATVFVIPLRRAGVETLPQFLMTAFGQPIRPLIAVCDSIGVFLTIPGQAASAIALMTVWVHWTLPQVAALVSVLIVIYVLTGGAISAGAAGFVKLFISFAALLVLGAVAVFLATRAGGTHDMLPRQYLSLFGNGFWKDIDNGLGIVFGVLTTQVYVQAVLCGRDQRHARIGALLAGLSTAVIGLGGVAVGMFMRVHAPGIDPAQTLPLFATRYFSPLISGVMLGAILITVITCAGGLALGIATMITRDLYHHHLRPQMTDHEGLRVIRIVIVLVVVAGVAAGSSNLLTLIINYSFLAFAFRADALLVPLVVAVIGRRTSLRSTGAGIGALLGGMAANLFWNFRIEQGGAAVFIGLMGSVVGLLSGHGVSIALRNQRGIPQPGATLN